MINKKYMYGQLNKETARANYGGEATDSMTIHVDNDKMLISGEVNWGNMLGQTPDKAYPGDLGARNYQKIVDLAKQLQQEIERSTAVDKQIQDKLVKDLAIVDDIQGLIDTAVESEQARAQKEEADLREAIARGDNSNRLQLTNLEAQTEEKFEQNKETVDSIILNLNALQDVVTSAIEQLTTSIETETSRAKIKENDLQSQIYSETNRAMAVESEFRTSLVGLTEDVQNLDEKIEEKLSESTSASEEDLRLLNSKVDEEIHRSKIVDNSLQLQLTNHEAAAIKLSQELAQTTLRVDMVEETLPEINDMLSEVRVDIDKEVSDRILLTDTLQQNLSDITKTVDNINTKLTQDLKQETTDRIEEDNKINVRIDSIVFDLPDRVASLEETVAELPTNIDSSLSELQQGLDNETSARITSDTNIVKYVDEQVSTLQDVDDVLKYRIDHMGANLANTFVQQIESDGDLRLYSVKGKDQDSVIASEDASSNTIVVRTDNGQIELPVVVTMKDTDRIGANQAVSKTFVKLLMGALEEDYNKQFSDLRGIKFIDGGNAPI